MLQRRFFSNWRNIPKVQTDSIMRLTEEFKKDKNLNKINLSIGSYKDEHGNPFVLESVYEAKQRIVDTNHEYASIIGNDNFNSNTKEFLFGSHNKTFFNNVSTVQTLSGTGACRLGAEFLHKICNHKTIYLPNKTWANHSQIMKNSGFNVEYYHYYDDNCNINSEKLFTDLFSAPDNSIFLFHVCAHNPTGIDPTITQWNSILNIIKEKKHVVFFDCAYQGFTSGNHDIDAYPVRTFLQDGNVDFIVAQSYSKNFGLYGERVGALNIFTQDTKYNENILSQLKSLIRPMYSNPPIYGSKIVNTILSDEDLFLLWKNDCNIMAKRIIQMRNIFINKLISEIPYIDWEPLKKQNGMFCYTSIDKKILHDMRKKRGIYITDDGRISIPGLNNKNLDYVVESIKESYNK